MKLSIVIPAFGQQSNIDDTLVSVLENRPLDCEVLLVHPNSYVDPYELADEVHFVEGTSADQFSLLNDGFKAARGSIVHTLCPGLTVDTGWCDAAIEEFEDDADLGSLAPSIFVGQSKSPTRGIAFHAGNGKTILYRRGKRTLAPLIQSGFFRRSAIQFMHGFDSNYGQLADAELGLRMRSANYRCIACGDTRIHQPNPSAVSKWHGFQAGQTRGRLFQKAKQLGLVSAGGGWWHLLTEPLRNGFGLGIVTGPLGRFACGSSKEVTVKTLPLDQHNSKADRHAA